MSIFQFRRSADDDLRSRLGELESAHQALAREHQSLRAGHAAQIDLLWTLASPAWLTESLELASRTGWRVERSIERRSIILYRPEGDEHTFSIPVPLPEDPEAVDRLRRELEMRLRIFARSAA